jgi:transposase
MTQICARCESQSIVKDYDYGRHCEYKKCQMCGSEKFKEKDLSKVTQNIPKIIPSVVKIVKKEEPMNMLSPEKIEIIEKEIQDGTSVRKLMKSAGIAKETARKYLNEHYEKTGEPRPENRGGSERKEENKDKPRPTCKEEGCDKWPVRSGLCTHHWSTEYRVGIKKGIAVAVPIKEEEKDMELKRGHKACKNHPEKYALVEDMCSRCYTKEHGHPYYGKRTPRDKGPEKEVKTKAKEERQLPEDLPVYKRSETTEDKIESLIRDREEDLKALNLVLRLIRSEAA